MIFEKINWEIISTQEIQKQSVKATVNDLPEIEQYLGSIVQVMVKPQIRVETSKQRSERFRAYKQNEIALRAVKLRIENERDLAEKEKDKVLREKLVEENLTDFRVCSTPEVDGYQRGMYSENILKFEKINSPVVDVRCQSGLTRKFDLRKIRTVYVQELIKDRGHMKVFVVESEGWFDRQLQKMTGIWDNGSAGLDTKRYKEVFATYIAIKVV